MSKAHVPIEKAKKHDHRSSIWAVAGGNYLWCYRCGAIRNMTLEYSTWILPTGPNGKNPALTSKKAQW